MSHTLSYKNKTALRIGDKPFAFGKYTFSSITEWIEHINTGIPPFKKVKKSRSEMKRFSSDYWGHLEREYDDDCDNEGDGDDEKKWNPEYWNNAMKSINEPLF